MFLNFKSTTKMTARIGERRGKNRVEKKKGLGMEGKKKGNFWFSLPDGELLAKLMGQRQAELQSGQNDTVLE